MAVSTSQRFEDASVPLILWKNFNQDNELYQIVVESGATQIMNRYYDRADLTNITGIVDGKEPANSQSFSYNDQNRLSGATATGTYGTLGLTPMMDSLPRP